MGLPFARRPGFAAVAFLAFAALALTALLPPAPAAAATAEQQALVAGAYHSCAVTRAGGLRCWGRNDHGQLGDGTKRQRKKPVAVRGLRGRVVAVAAGDWHSCALTEGGAVLCWGDNRYGQLGDGSNAASRRPRQVRGLRSGVAAISATYHHSCAVTTAGRAFCWGSNDYGQLGDGTTEDRNLPVTPLRLGNGVAEVAVGGRHSCARLQDGRVRCWGWNERGQLGTGDFEDRTFPVLVQGLFRPVRSLSAGWSHNCAIEEPFGGLRCWGWNNNGQLGDGTRANRPVATKVRKLTSDVRAVSGGGAYSCAMTSRGALRCWGHNFFGQLGNGTLGLRKRPSPVRDFERDGALAISTGSAHSCALLPSGQLRCWGWNEHGQIGDDTTTNRRVPTRVKGTGFGPG